MYTCRRLLAILFMAVFSAVLYADSGSAPYKHGLRAEQHGDYDQAVSDFKQAYTLVPGNAKYLVAYTRARFTAANQHLHSGQLLRNTGDLKGAMKEFQRAVEIDASSFIAQQELRRTMDQIVQQERQQSAPKREPAPKVADQLAPPLQLQPLSNAPISVYMTANADVVYKTIGKLAGFNVVVDPDYKPQKITIDLNNVTLRDALDMVRLESKTFWRPVLTNAIFVSADSSGKRKELEQNVMKTFYLQNIETPNDLQEAANVLRQMLDVSRVQLVQAQDALILRGTPDQMVLAEKLLADFDKPRSEVVIDIMVMEVNRDRIQNLGTTLPTSFSITPVAPGSSSSTSTSSTNSSGGNTTSSAFTFNNLLKTHPGSFLLGISGGSFSILASDSNTKILQNPEIRVLNNEKATLRIGDRVPIATGSYQAGLVGGASVSPLVSTQFTYLDVGVNIDITPHIHANGEVTLKMSLEISSVASEQNIGGITEPVIGQRRIEHETRLVDGEVSLLGGILEDTETQSMSGYPWVSKIPILRYLFAQDNKERQQNEIVFAITPHLVRAQHIDEENTAAIEVGTGNSIELRRKIQAAPAPSAEHQSEPAKSQAPAAPKGASAARVPVSNSAATANPSSTAATLSKLAGAAQARP